MERDIGWSLEAVLAETRATVGHLAEDMSELRRDVRCLDDRIFQLMLITLATLATTLATLVANLVS
jgi:hypothetical protein